MQKNYSSQSKDFILLNSIEETIDKYIMMLELTNNENERKILSDMIKVLTKQKNKMEGIEFSKSSFISKSGIISLEDFNQRCIKEIYEF